MVNIVLLEPEIPMNTGNIARTCAATGGRLHLIEPLGFDISDARVKRAGLDYWHLVDISVYPSLADFRARNRAASCYYLTTKSDRVYADLPFEDGCHLFFGKETRGLPEELLSENDGRTARIPMKDGARSLNLANAVAVVVYEALRQQGFPGIYL